MSGRSVAAAAGPDGGGGRGSRAADRGAGSAATAGGAGGGEAWWVEAGLRVFFWAARSLPWALRWSRGAWVWAAWAAAAEMRRAVRANLRRVLPEGASEAEVDRVGRGVVASFYAFVCEVAANHRRSLPELIARIERVEGGEAFLAERQRRRGAVLVTAHFGNFEVGLAAMREIEPRVHVVFQRDRMGRFERLRRELHQRLGIVETPIDDGMASWLALRDALQADGVVMLQGDRTMPGQRGLAVEILGPGRGHVELPIGPAKLAAMTGAPLVPVFAIRRRGGKVEVRLGRVIEVARGGEEAATRAVGLAIGEMIRECPRQWHVLQRAFVEDGAAAGSGVEGERRSAAGQGVGAG